MLDGLRNFLKFMVLSGKPSFPKPQPRATSLEFLSLLQRRESTEVRGTSKSSAFPVVPSGFTGLDRDGESRGEGVVI